VTLLARENGEMRDMLQARPTHTHEHLPLDQPDFSLPHSPLKRAAVLYLVFSPTSSRPFLSLSCCFCPV